MSVEELSSLMVSLQELPVAKIKKAGMPIDIYIQEAEQRRK